MQAFNMRHGELLMNPYTGPLDDESERALVKARITREGHYAIADRYLQPHLYGVSWDDPAKEIDLVKIPQSTYPIHWRRCIHALLAMETFPDGSLRDAVSDIFVRYEARRAQGHHAGPRLRGVRLYNVERVFNSHPPYGPPTIRRTLVFEASSNRLVE
jgi:hypothetical protein